MKIIVLALLLTLTGCASTGQTKFITRVETVTVYKPVYTPPTELQKMSELKRPDLATNHFTETDKKNPGLVIKSTIAAIAQLRTYAESLESQNSTYRKILSKPADPIPETERSVKTHESDKPFKD